MLHQHQQAYVFTTIVLFLMLGATVIPAPHRGKISGNMLAFQAVGCGLHLAFHKHFCHY